MKLVEFDKEENYIKEFINLPKRLYSKSDNMEDETEMKKLLLNNHPLNKYFKLYKYLVFNEEEVVGRFIFTEYDNDDTLYLGFFECINDKKTAKYLFDNAYKIAKKKNKSKIIGPVDASFWLKYRLKINLFNKRPYTGEPYNKDYYFDLFKNNKYKVVEHYTSNIYNVVYDEYSNTKFNEHFDEFIKLGYSIVSPKVKDYDNVLESLYYLLTELYSDFPIYKHIELKDFITIFQSYKKIINMNMIKLAYYQDKLVGFFISVPNYNNLVYHLNIYNIIKILSLKHKPKEYVLLYMGVDQSHRGLGKALAHSITEELRISKLPSIGALARDGKLTQNYASDMIDSRYEYVLLERSIV